MTKGHPTLIALKGFKMNLNMTEIQQLQAAQQFSMVPMQMEFEMKKLTKSHLKVPRLLALTADQNDRLEGEAQYWNDHMVTQFKDKQNHMHPIELLEHARDSINWLIKMVVKNKLKEEEDARRKENL